nr:hypothetical protein GCM10020092_029400 [Actinoplanes digitatis]
MPEAGTPGAGPTVLKDPVGRRPPACPGSICRRPWPGAGGSFGSGTGGAARQPGGRMPGSLRSIGACRPAGSAGAAPRRGGAWPGMDWPGMGWPGMDWPGMDWPGMDWPGTG